MNGFRFCCVERALADCCAVMPARRVGRALDDALRKRLKQHPFVADHEVQVSGERYILDFYFPVALLGIECHSFRWHMGLHDDDARRDRRNRSLGIEILYFTWDDVAHHPDEVEREIRTAIDRRLTTSSGRGSS